MRRLVKFISKPMENSDQNVVAENAAAPVEQAQQQPTAEAQTPPVEAQSSPEEAQTTPAEEQAPAEEAQTPPVEAQSSPEEAQTTPAEEQAPAEEAQSTPAEEQAPAEEAQTAPAEEQAPAEEAQTPSPLPTYESINVDAPVVTADVIEERLKKAAPLSSFQNASRRKRERPRAEGDEKGEKTERRPREERERVEREITAAPKPGTSAILPNRREGLGDLEDEFAALCAGHELESMMTASVDAKVSAAMIEDGTKVTCKVDTITKDSVFVNLGATELGLVPLKQFPDDMELSEGQEFDAVVTKFNSAEGYYEVSLPLAAAEIGDWFSITKDAIVEARVTGVNKGGLEVEVGRLRGFLPAGQVQLADFDLDGANQFIGEVWKCIVTEVNPERRNLVVSRRKLLQMERAELREQTLAELEVGQTREGVVRKLIDVGAFVDLGGVDGFIHVSQMGWGRVNKPGDVVKVGDKVKVTLLKIDNERKRISLSLRDAAADPWYTVESEYNVGDIIRGTVTKLMDFGAFVQLPNGLEGLVHISEIAYQRINKVSDALTAGDVVDVKVLSVEPGKKRISLSIKKTQDDPRVKEREEAQAKADAEATQAEIEARKREEAEDAERRERIAKLQPKKPLKGGLGRTDDSDKFGLRL
jgi:ribosomal protein S1